MNHSFNIEIANSYGIESAIIIENMAFWTKKNIANDSNKHEDRYWVYNSIKAWGKLFPYWTDRQISRILKKMEENGIITVGNFNKSAYDRTKWYCLAESILQTWYSISPNGQMEKPEQSNGCTEKVKPIPVINTVVETNINNKPVDGKSKKTKHKKAEAFTIEINHDDFKGWREDFKLYKKYMYHGFLACYKNKDFMEDLEKRFSKLNVVETIKKAYVEYWSSERGWRHYLTKPTKKIGFTLVLANICSYDFNHVTK